VAAPCARLQLVRGPVRNGGRGRPFNGIVRHQPMRVSRVGSSVTVQLADHGVFCPKCGHLFREFHILSDQPFEKCPRCRTRGPFRKATQSEIDAYAQTQMERRRLKPSDYWKAGGLLIIIGLIVAAISKWVVDA